MNQRKHAKFVDNNSRQITKEKPRFDNNASPQFKYPILQRNRTQSEVSYEGNTIDMVRIVRKNQQARRSRINIDRKQYQKFQRQGSPEKGMVRFSQTRSVEFEDKTNQHNHRLSSTLVHKGSINPLNQQKISIQHYIRPSTIQILKNQQNHNNPVLGFTLLILFLLLMCSQIYIGTYMFHSYHMIYRDYDYIIVFDDEYMFDSYFMDIFQRIMNYNFIYVVVLYLTAEVAYHGVIWGIQKYTNNKYKLIDRQTSKLNYILRCRDLRRRSNNFLQDFIKKPLFTVFLISLSTFLYTFGIIYCYYWSQFNLIYGEEYLSTRTILLIEIFYYAVILPETITYLFFQSMHLSSAQKGRTSLDNSSQSQQQFRSDYFTSPFINIDISTWWNKLALIILTISIFYSIFTTFWLIIICFAKIQIKFKKIKYRMDTFYIETYTKLLFLIFCLTGFLLIVQQPSTITFNFGAQCFICIIIGMLLSRVLSCMFIRTQLYKYFYTQMHINLALIIFIFISVYLFSLTSYYYEFMSVNTLLIGIYSILLFLSIYTEGNHQQTIKFDLKNTRKSDMYVQMNNF